MLPPPTLSFTIPSVHDGLVLQCRIYHPTCLAPKAVSRVVEWRKRAAIVAHPYAPLGGCFDDPVVNIVASTILNNGFVVGTFNFRGAGDSQGRTSWQSKAEQNDYTSFIGFIVYYLHHLQPPNLPVEHQSVESTNLEQEGHTLSPITSQVASPPNASSGLAMGFSPPVNTNIQPLLLLSGYSYGALITTSLSPILASTMSSFQTPITGSPHAEIRLRAVFLAGQQTELMNERLSSLISKHSLGRTEKQTVPSPKSHSATGSVRIGGHEDLRKSSHESHRSKAPFQLDPQVRRSLDRVRTIATSSSLSHKSFDTANYPPSEIEERSANVSLKAIPEIATHLQSAYLLISPLHGWVNSLATMTLFSRASRIKPAHDTKLTIDPTLALFGDDDVFVSISKLRAWAERMQAACAGEEPTFRYREVAGAGHFWHDREAVRILMEEVGRFVAEL